jgi:penicillin-binding protein 1B
VHYPKIRAKAGWIVVGIFASVVLFFFVKLDRTIVNTFDSKRYRQAARVHARALELFPGGDFNPNYFKKELLALGYKQTGSAAKVGEFAVKGDRFIVNRNSFDFFEGHEKPLRFSITHADRRIVEIEADGKSLDTVRLEPLVIGSIYPNRIEDRKLVKLDSVPSTLVDGLILLEDKDFYHHGGVDIGAIARAMVTNLKAGKIAQGGSTLTQQLVKNFFLTSERSWRRKIQEAIYALLLELHYDKKDILETYLNEVYFGQDGPIAVYGFGLAAEFYYGKRIEDLTLAQQASLIAMLNGPSYYDPRRHPSRLTSRRNKVLQLLFEEEKIKKQEYEKALASPIISHPKEVPYYAAYLDLVKQHLARDYGESDLQEAGLKIHTSFNPVTQWVAQEAVDELFAGKLRRYPNLNIAVVVATIEGEVEALISNRKSVRLGYNRALKAARSIGSLVKPIVTTAAFEKMKNMTLMTRLEDQPISIQLDAKRSWTPENFDHQYHGSVTVIDMLTHSYNAAAVDLGQKTGLPAVEKTLEKLLGSPVAVNHPSAFLGAVTLTPYQVAQIYQTIANDGFRSPLRSVRHVQNRDNAGLKAYALQTKKVIDAETVFLVKFALRQVVLRGTAAGAASWLKEGQYAAGKTGTSSGGRDLWFAGFSGNRVVVVWVGNDKNASTPFTGGAVAMPVFAKIIGSLGEAGENTVAPPGVNFVAVHPGSGERVEGECEGVLTVPFIQGTEPVTSKPCDLTTPDAEGKGLFQGMLDKIFGW